MARPQSSWFATGNNANAWAAGFPVHAHDPTQEAAQILGSLSR